MSPYKEALKDLQMIKIMEKAIIELEKKEEEDPSFIHLNIEMLSQTIEVLLKLKGTLQKRAN